ncbi:MAG TPA: peptidase U32 family protein [Treponemataceae bacterium]|nr:peptidase U32 family protein [Treponemataceae bacterium]
MAELLAPAGNVEALDAAIGEGADAVYMGLKSFNARLRSSNFAWNQFESAVEAVHRRGKKIFVTVNTVSEESELERLYRFLEYLNRIGPDGLIVQDFGVVRMIQEFFPNLQIHASTQMNVASAAGVNQLSRQGIKRVVLSRELDLDEIIAIKAQTTAELEVFVHGALCVSESGLCLFSSYLGGKSANRGMCTQACRRFYETGFQGKLKKGYFFSPHDLQLIDQIPDLVTAGVDSFKIEGRMKSAEYVGTVTAAYRYVLDHWQEDKKGALATARRMLSTDFARAKTQYWYNSSDAENFLNPDQAGGTGLYLGKIVGLREDGHMYAKLGGGTYEPEIGDSIRLHKKDDSNRASHKVKSLKGSIEDLWIEIPSGFGVGDEVYLLQTKTMSKRYNRVLAKDLSKYRQQPGAGRLPILDLTPISKDNLSYLPKGLYIQVSSVRDIYSVLGEHPVRIILEWNTATRSSIIEEQENLPISKRQLYISLDPFCPADTEKKLIEDLEYLVGQGYSNWVVNNLAHINIISKLKGTEKKGGKRKKMNLIAGPYLYTFNRWAVSFLENQNIDGYITPLENSRRNLEATFEKKFRSRVLVTVFSYPALFRMRFELPKNYDFEFFHDKHGEEFRALSTPDGSFVMPEKPFSLLDKVVYMEKAGFSHFLIDMSRTSITKGEIRTLVKSLKKGQPLPDISRFNWKDGFYDPEKIERYKEATAAKRNERFQQRKRSPRKNKKM